MRHAQLQLSRDVPQRIAALVAVCSGIGQLTTADAIENDENDARKGCQGWDDER